MKKLFPLLCLLASCSNPRAFIDVQVESDLTVPDQVDALDLTLLPSEGDVPIEEHTFTVVPEKPFPLHVVLQPDADAPHDIRIHLVATLGGNPVASAGIAYSWQDDHINEVTMTLEDLP